MRQGKLRFLYGALFDDEIRAFRENANVERVIVIARPGEMSLANPAEVVRTSDGVPQLLIFDERW